MSAEDPIEALARSVLEGAEVDWDRAEAEVGHEGAVGRVRALREVARIVAFNQALQRDGSAEDGSEPDPPGETIRPDPEDLEQGP
jgi:hypothetical protein